MPDTALISVLVAVASAVAGAVASYYGWKAKKMTSEGDQRTRFYEAVMHECDALRHTSTELQKQVIELKAQVEILEEELEFYRQNILPTDTRVILAFVMNTQTHPMWIHHVGENKWYLNDEYCRQFNVIRRDFWTPVNLFAHYDSADILDYTRNDIRVIDANASCQFVESARTRIMDPNCTDVKFGLFRKSPLQIGDNSFILGELLSDLEYDQKDVSLGQLG